MNRTRGFLLALVGALLVLTAMIVIPFLQYVLVAVTLAYVLYPAFARLESRLPPTAAALTVVTGAICGLLAPFVAVTLTVAEHADRVRRELDADSIPTETIESRIASLTGANVDLTAVLERSGRDAGRILFERSTEAFGVITFHVLGVLLAIFLTYYLLKDGETLFRWLEQTVPLPASIQRKLYSEIDGVMWGVLVGHVFVAVVQGVVAGLGFYATGVPNATFWTAVMAVMAMLPLVGTIPVWGGAVGYLYLTDEPLLAAALFVYCVVVVGLTDDYLRPFAVDRYARLNPAIVLLGILGGGYAFGVMGLFYGPVVLGALKAALGVLAEDWDRIDDAVLSGGRSDEFDTGR